MPSALKITLYIGIFIYFILILSLLKKGALTLKYTLAWLFSGVVIFILVVFPEIIYWFSVLLGIHNGMNGLFVAVIGFMLMILLTITSIVSNQRNKIKILAHEVAFLEKRIRKLEEKEYVK